VTADPDKAAHDPVLRFIAGYPGDLQQQVLKLVADGGLRGYLLGKYPVPHKVANDADLREYVMALKNEHLKKAPPLSKIIYDNAIHVLHDALGLHTYVSRVQGTRLKSKNEIRISTAFRKAPERLLRMVVVHELAHLKEKEHGKEFYQLCQHMLPDYFQLEFDARLLLLLQETEGALYR